MEQGRTRMNVGKAFGEFAKKRRLELGLTLREFC